MTARSLQILTLAAGCVLAVVAYRVQVHNLGAGTSPARATATLGAGLAFVLTGLVAWSRRPQNRLGPLMIVAGFAILARQFRYSFDPLAFTVFFALGELGYALFAHVVFAYPTGVVTDRLERAFLKVAYTAAITFPFVLLLFYDGSRPLRYFPPFPHRSLLLVHGDADVVHGLQSAYAVLVYGVLASMLILLVLRRLWLATPRARRILLPMLAAAVAAALRSVFDGIQTFSVHPPEFVSDNVFWWQIGAITALPLAMLAVFLRTRLATASLGELIVRLERTPPEGTRDELARALDDPSLEVAFWLPEHGEFRDVSGAPVVLPTDDSHRSVTPIERNGEPLAALVHDPSLRDEPELVEAVAAAARLALENARLQADLRAQIVKLQESRARIAAAADEERRRIERDLHDGLQSQLVAIGLKLKQAQRRDGGDELLAAVAGDLERAIRELRELVHGIHPAVLVQGGLAAALATLADRTPVTLTIDATRERFAATIESAAYFVASEALLNVAKHSGATRASVVARREDDRLVIEVVDDGAGGAQLDGGTGLRGLADRLEALGGQLAVDAAAGGGTRLVGVIPCAS